MPLVEAAVAVHAERGARPRPLSLVGAGLCQPVGPRVLVILLQFAHKPAEFGSLEVAGIPEVAV